MSRVIVLDAGPLGFVTNPRGNPEASACYEWMLTHLAANAAFVVPEIADYEVWRELLRIGKLTGLRRLDGLITNFGFHYHPLTTTIMRQAAEFWAIARRGGRPTADPHSLDCDVILAAQVHGLMAPNDDVIVATTNVRHLSIFVQAAEWRDIRSV